ncbi:Uncharacterised protein [Lysinibacillus sphaericus]|nr:Uncharacterised protein [Lysinibacillus sphaericus]
MADVHVIDSIMGSGKTTFMIEEIKRSNPADKFIFITPYQTEIDRIQSELASVGKEVFIPTVSDNAEKRKLQSMKNAIIDGKSILSTHSLFTLADDELITLIKQGDYSLILDEVMDVVEGVNVSKGDLESMLSKDYIAIEPDGKVRWIDRTYSGTSFSKVQRHANSGSLYLVEGTYLIWAYPPKIFGVFDHIYLLTYLFEGSAMYQYFQIYGITHEKFAVRNGEMVEYDRTAENRMDVYAKINVYQGPMNDDKNEHYLSSNWLKRNGGREPGKQLRKNLVNWFKNINSEIPSNQKYWTTLKSHVPQLKGNGYASRFIPHNIRATNDYMECTVLAYAYNRFLHPDESKFFSANGKPINEELRAVSDLLQWIWRSAIREGNPIELYLPSMRMRRLLHQWANNEI